MMDSSLLEERIRGALHELPGLLEGGGLDEAPTPIASRSPYTRGVVVVVATAAVAAVLFAPAIWQPGPESSESTVASTLDDRDGPAVATDSPRPLATAEEVDAVAAELADLHEIDGFSQVRVEEQARRIELLWVGRPPEEVFDIVKRAGLRGVNVDVLRSAYSEADVERIGQRVFGMAGSGPGWQVSEVSPNEEFNRIEIMVALTPNHSLPPVSTFEPFTDGIPVTIVSGHAVVPAS